MRIFLKMGVIVVPVDFLGVKFFDLTGFEIKDGYGLKIIGEMMGTTVKVVPDSSTNCAGNIGKPLKAGDTLVKEVVDGKRQQSTGGHFHFDFRGAAFVIVDFGEI